MEEDPCPPQPVPTRWQGAVGTEKTFDSPQRWSVLVGGGIFTAEPGGERAGLSKPETWEPTGQGQARPPLPPPPPSGQHGAQPGDGDWKGGLSLPRGAAVCLWFLSRDSQALPVASRACPTGRSRQSCFS